MKPNEIRAQVRVGQYWLNKYDNKIYKVTNIGPSKYRSSSDHVAKFNDYDWDETLPLNEYWVHLWITKRITPEYFSTFGEVKEGQIWVINGILVFIGPNWKDTDGWITVLSDESFWVDVFCEPLLYQEAL